MKNILIVVILSVVLFSLGCQSNNPSSTPERLNIHTGTEGLVMNLLKDQPPDKIVKGSSFSILLELANKGAYDIEDGYIMIGGFNPYYIYLENKNILFSLQGKSISYPEGDKDLIQIKVKNVNIPEGRHEYSTTLKLLAYYNYETDASAEVCINPNIYDYVKTDNVGCEVKEISLSGGQGAPIAVTKIEQLITSPSDISSYVDIQFRMHVANRGDGKLQNDEVILNKVILSNQNINCVPKSLTLKENEDKYFTCKASIPRETTPYLSPIKINLGYVYINELTKKIKIVSLT